MSAAQPTLADRKAALFQQIDTLDEGAIIELQAIIAELTAPPPVLTPAQEAELDRRVARALDPNVPKYTLEELDRHFEAKQIARETQKWPTH